MIIKVVISILAISCIFDVVLSASVATAAATKPKMTTEGPDVVEKSDHTPTESPSAKNITFDVSTEAAIKHKMTTEGPDKISTEGPLANKNTTAIMESNTFEDYESKLKDIFTVTTLASKTASNESESKDTKNSPTNNTIAFGSRSNFDIRPNCRCVVHNHCAKKNSCLKKPR